MTEWDMDTDKGGFVPRRPSADGSAVLCRMTREEFRDRQPPGRVRHELLHEHGSVRCCRIEADADGAFGVLRFPQKGLQRAPHLTLGFRLTAQTLILIEDTGHLHDWPEKASEHLLAPQTPAECLLSLLMHLTEEDMPFLSHLDEQIARMEEQALHEVPDGFFESLLHIRHKLTELGAFYEQLAEVAQFFTDAPETAGRIGLWQAFAARLGRRQSYCTLLYEYTLHLREFAQSAQEARQNRVIGILTIVTTLFLPLTLVTGWYGMNFSGMPELHWRFGYPLVILLTAATVVAEILYFRKKHLF